MQPSLEDKNFDPSSPLLVVDDEFANRDMLARRLKRAGYEVDTAENAKAALAKIEQQQYGLILLDSMMPEMSGVELLRLLRGTYSQEEMPVIMVTALAESEKVVESLDLGANDYITKPIDFPIALARIRSHLKRTEQSKRRPAEILPSEESGCWTIDLAAGRSSVDRTWEKQTGWKQDQVPQGQLGWIDLTHPEDRKNLLWLVDRAREVSSPMQLEYRIRNNHGIYRWMSCQASLERNSEGQVIKVTGRQKDVTDTKTVDQLTHLGNRLRLEEEMEACLIGAAQTGHSRYALLLLNLDQFRSINDTFGHNQGDAVLVEVARRLDALAQDWRTSGSGNLTLVRLGSDEFAIFLHYCRFNTEAQTMAKAIHEALRPVVRVEDRDLQVSATIGIVSGAEVYQDSKNLLRDADMALTLAKKKGHGESLRFDPGMRRGLEERARMEQELSHAVERGEIEVYFQPKVRLSDGLVVGFEALARWKHPSFGLVPPIRFIPLAEETGLILEIGKFVLYDAARKLVEWNKCFQFPRPLDVSVNVSVKQICQPELVQTVADVLTETGIPPHLLLLEVTESVLIENVGQALDTFNRIKALGVGLKIDDFGTGYSSLSYLKQLPFDSLKIDRSFISDMCSNSSSRQIVQTLLNLSHSLGMHVVAEGVESEDQMRALDELGCELAQGYLFSRPMPSADVENWLAERQKEMQAPAQVEALPLRK